MIGSLQVVSNRLSNRFCEHRRNGIPNLPPLRLNTSRQREGIGKGLQSLYLANTQDAIAPVKRPHVVRTPRLYCPRWQIGTELKKKAPIAGAPYELRLR